MLFPYLFQQFSLHICGSIYFKVHIHLTPLFCKYGTYSPIFSLPEALQFPNFQSKPCYHISLIHNETYLLFLPIFPTCLYALVWLFLAQTAFVWWSCVFWKFDIKWMVVRLLSAVCLSLFTLTFENRWAYFNEIKRGRNTIKGYSKLLLSAFL